MKVAWTDFQLCAYAFAFDADRVSLVYPTA